MQSKPRQTLAISVCLKEKVAPDTLIMTFPFGQQKSQHRLSTNDNIVNTETRKLGTIQAACDRAVNPEEKMK
jgi:hypothetical protein